MYKIRSIFLGLTLLLLGAVSVNAQAVKAFIRQSRDLTPVKIDIEQGKPALLLSKNGSAKVKLVIPAKFPTSYYRDIARIIKRYLDQATGAKFKIVRGDISTGKGIFIGPCSDKTVLKAFNALQQKQLETIEIRSFSRGIMIIGNDQPGELGVYKEKIHISHKKYSKGTLFAATDFLERLIGFRFYFPGKLGTTFPDYRKISLSIPYLSSQDRPVFTYRIGSQAYYETSDAALSKTKDKAVRLHWMVMMRKGDVLNQRLSHTDNDWEKVFSDHPEYFALSKSGTRMMGEGHGTQRCYASEAGLKAHIEAIKSFYKDGSMGKAFASRSMYPDEHYIRWWPNDGFHGCYCEKCQKLIDHDAPRNRRISRLIWDYVIRLSKEVKKNFPNKKLLVSLYSDWRTMPAGVKIPDNVIVIPVLPGTGYSLAYMKEPKYWDLAMKDFKQVTTYNAEPAWLWVHYPHRPRISSNIYAPYPIPHVLARFVRLCKGKFSGFGLNGHSATVLAFDNIMIYLWNKLSWNPDINEDIMLEEYCQRMFGPAASTMLEYWQLLGDSWENSRWSKLPDLEHPMKRMEKLFSKEKYFKESYPKAVRKKLQALLNRALSETPAGSIYQQRMKWMVQASQKFFEQGNYFDGWDAAEMDCLNMTPKLDGKIVEWKKYKPATLLDNSTNKPVKPETKLWFSRDAKNLYIAGQVSEPSGKFNSKGKQKRDYPIWKAADIEIFICADRPEINAAGFSQRAQFHQIIINEAGSIYDGYQKYGGSLDNSVNIDFQLKINKYATGYDFEIKLPFASLGANIPKAGDEWPINIFRTHKGKRTTYHAWAPTRGSFHDTSRYGVLKFK